MFTTVERKIVWPNKAGKIVKWLYKVGERVSFGDALAECEPSTICLYSPVNGIVMKLNGAVGENMKPHSVVAAVQPRHPKDEAMMEGTLSTSSSLIGTRMASIEIQQLFTDAVRSARAASLLRMKKIALILDLDLTILNSCIIDKVGVGFSASNFSDVFQLTADGNLQYYVKFRPGCADFLKKASEICEIHVYTMGTREYAKGILNLITERLVGRPVIDGKLLTRCDTGSSKEKSMQSILPGLEHMSLILDDRSDVWETSKGNLVSIYPYRFFQGHDTDKNGSPEKKPEEWKTKEPPDTHLNSMLDVIKDVHAQFYSQLHKTMDITEHLRWRQQKVLTGVHLVFSGIFPLGVPPEDQSLWKQAESFGGTCHKALDPAVTHLVAAREGTEKVLEASTRGNIFLVNPGWIYDSLAHWVRLDERMYRVK